MVMDYAKAEFSPALQAVLEWVFNTLMPRQRLLP